MGKSAITRDKTSLEAIDPFEASTGCLLVIAFPRSNSRNFPVVVSIAEGASKYAVASINGAPMHVALFAKTPADAGRASALFGYIQSWKGTLVFVQGRVVHDRYRLPQVLECYVNSCSCRDKAAHCYQVIDGPFSMIARSMTVSISVDLSMRLKPKKTIEINRFVFPCRHLFPFFRFEEGHPSSVQDQIQAAGVQHGCHICPNFFPDEYKKVGARTILRDLFE